MVSLPRLACMYARVLLRLGESSLGFLGDDPSVYMLVAKTLHHGSHEQPARIRMIGP